MKTHSYSIQDENKTVTRLKHCFHSLQTSVDLDTLLDKIGDAKVVMLGEASHGTHEYYTWRALITQRLIEEKGFNFVGVEGDWPDCYRLNRYVKNYSGAGSSAFEVLHAFNRWPTWMWANWEMVAFSEWLYNHNTSLATNKKIGFYGLDVYSLWESMEAIISYLQKVDPDALAVAQKAFQCFEPYQRDEGRGYAYASLIVPEPCTKEVVNLLTEMQQRAPHYNSDEENVFSAGQNARVTFNAEKYYRAMLHGGKHTWNIRDEHMEDTLERLLHFHGKNSKAIIWAHNTHVGDARATDMRFEGMHNIGELARRRFGNDNVYLVGFGSYGGSVIAASGWGEKSEYMDVPSAMPGSWEHMLKRTSIQSGYLLMEDFKDNGYIEDKIGHRAIGVVYHPDVEQYGNYVLSILPERYDAFIFLEQTKALHGLHVSADSHQVPETYPFGV